MIKGKQWREFWINTINKSSKRLHILDPNQAKGINNIILKNIIGNNLSKHLNNLMYSIYLNDSNLASLINLFNVFPRGNNEFPEHLPYELITKSMAIN